MRQDVTGYTLRTTGEQAPDHPKKFTVIDVLHEITGVEVQEASVRRAIQLSITRYCPVYATISPGVVVDERYRILDSEGREVAAGKVEPARD
jgi:putative redox protein